MTYFAVGYDISVTITGATGVLGTALTRQVARASLFPGNRIKLYLSHHDEFKIRRLRQDLKPMLGLQTLQVFSCSQDLEQSVTGSLPRTEWVDWKDTTLDIERQSESTSVDRKVSTHHHQILINCAAVNLFGSSQHMLQRSFSCNAVSPILLARQFMLSQNADHRNDHTSNNITIVNISSGDGEEVCINSSINQQLEAVTSVDELLGYMRQLVDQFSPDLEYAFGTAPMYSLSKRMLNKATQLLHREFVDEYDSQRIRIMACCPGNFVSPLSSVEEQRTANPVESVAMKLIEGIDQALLDNSSRQPLFASGKFYRHGKEISF
jgi:NAD(P)-dependent dehydrogenase (short-subunit alcohol dehydrogenase family)